jgi:hypothetical protein
MSRSRWGGVCLSGRGDNGCEAETDASVDVDVGLSGGDFAGSGVGRISLFAADAGLLLLWLKGGAVCSLIEHFWGRAGRDGRCNRKDWMSCAGGTGQREMAAGDDDGL